MSTTFKQALKVCRPNGASAVVIAQVPAMIEALQATEKWFTTRPDETDLSGHMGVANFARAEAIEKVRRILRHIAEA